MYWGINMIRTNRLILTPISMEHSEDLFELWSDFEVIKYTNAQLITKLSESRERITLWLEKYIDPKCPNHFAVLLDKKAIGITGFPIINHDDFQCGFYYHFARKYWGKGYGSEAAEALLGYIFKNYPNATIFADTVSVNPASIAILKKIGFIQTYLEEGVFNNNGMKLDLVHFKIERIS